MERIERVERSRGRFAALAFLVVSMALGGCTTAPSSPETQLSWPVGATYTVHAGDTLSEIAEDYRTSEYRLAAYNEIGDRDLIYAGQVLRIPRDSYAAPSRPTARPAYRPRPQPRRDVEVASTAPRKTYERPAPRDPDEPAQAYAGPLRFVWPVDGPVISSFGSSRNGERNDGINIAANLGEPIHAAAAGTVTYAGNELKGYGNLVLIRHDDGYVTAYAHAERIAVDRGERVTKGQVIGYAGATGDVSRPQLHFEIRHGVEPVDPKPLLMASAT